MTFEMHKTSSIFRQMVQSAIHHISHTTTVARISDTVMFSISSVCRLVLSTVVQLYTQLIYPCPIGVVDVFTAV